MVISVYVIMVVTTISELSFRFRLSFVYKQQLHYLIMLHLDFTGVMRNIGVFIWYQNLRFEEEEEESKIDRVIGLHL